MVPAASAAQGTGGDGRMWSCVLPLEAVMLNIKDPEAHVLATSLAKQTGETLTKAVKEALRERLARVRRSRRAGSDADELLAIGRRCAATLKRKPASHAALLYDKRGLPR